ncbi:hypothetical protein M3Y97_00348800 [Aphelenchoides bicaudatus]|nr:hypothetical protein M3Y97_00348800 [Aphelenchoides bicaudatus]
MISRLLLSLLISYYAVQANSSSKHKVFQLYPSTADELTEIIKLHNDGEVDFWKSPSVDNTNVDVMIRPDQMTWFYNFLNTTQIEHRILVQDLEKLIDEKEGPNSVRSRAIRLLSGAKRDDASAHTFGLIMGEYYGYDDIVAFMRRVNSAIPNRSRMFSIGKTVEGRDTWALEFGNVQDRTRPIIWIDGGIHAREWTAIHTGYYFIQLIANAILDNRDGTHKQINEVLRIANIIVLPCANPDGYEYTRTDPHLVEYRFWRKNFCCISLTFTINMHSRSPTTCKDNQNGERRCCGGVDLNRNFAFKFATLGTSFHPCSEIFSGTNAFSEPESRNIRDAIINSDFTGRIQALITMHAYSQLLIYPYSNKKHFYPPDIADLKSVARRAADKIGEKFGTHYMIGTGPEIIYAYTGGSSDWAKETANIKYTYTIELRPGFYAWNGFVLDKSQLIPTARETFDGVQVIMDAAIKHAQTTGKVHEGVTTNNGNNFRLSSA